MMAPAGPAREAPLSAHATISAVAAVQQRVATFLLGDSTAISAGRPIEGETVLTHEIMRQVDAQEDVDLQAAAALIWAAWCRSHTLVSGAGPNLVIPLADLVGALLPDVLPPQLVATMAAVRSDDSGVLGATSWDSPDTGYLLDDEGDISLDRIDIEIGFHELAFLTLPNPADWEGISRNRPTQLPGLFYAAGRTQLIRCQLDNGAPHLDAAISALRSCADISQEMPLVHRPATMVLLTALQTRLHSTGQVRDASELLDRGEALLSLGLDSTQALDLLPALTRTAEAKLRTTADANDLDQLIRLAQSWLDLEPPDSVTRRDALQHLATALASSAFDLGTIEQIDVALTAQLELLACTPAHHPDRSRADFMYASLLTLRYDLEPAPEDLDAAIAITRQAVAATSNADSDASLLLMHGRLTGMRYEISNSELDADESVESLTAAVELTDPTDEAYPGTLSLLVMILGHRFGQQGAADDLQLAARYGAMLLVAPEIDRADAATSALRSLQNDVLRRQSDSVDPQVLDTAVESFRSLALTADPASDVGMLALTVCANMLMMRWQTTSDSADLDEVIELGRRAPSEPTGDPHWWRLRSSMCGGLRARYETSGNQDDLDEALALSSAGTEAAEPLDPAVVPLLADRTSALRLRYQLFGDVDDLAASISTGRRGLAVADAEPADLITLQAYLANSLARSFDVSADASALDEAVALIEASCADVDDAAASQYLSALADILEQRFVALGQQSDLDRAVVTARQAVALSKDNAGGDALSGLAAKLRARYQVDQQLDDLQEVISLYRRVLDVIRPQNIRRVDEVSNLGLALGERYQRLSDPADLAESIALAERALALIPADHRQRAWFLVDLAGARHRGAFGSNDPAVLDQVIELYQEAIELTDPRDQAVAWRMCNLSNALRDRFSRSGEQIDIDRAVDIARSALTHLRPNDPMRAKIQLTEGFALSVRYAAGHRLDDARDCLRVNREVALLVTNTPADRVRAAAGWGHRAADCDDDAEALRAFSLAIEILPRLAWHGLDRATREMGLSEWAGLGANAATFAVRCGRPELAVELLEQGRSVLWTELAQLRTDLATIAELAPGLAEDLAAAGRILQTPIDRNEHAPGATEHWTDSQLALDARRDAARAWDRGVAQIRLRPGWENFLRPTPFAELSRAATGGPIVMLTVSPWGAMALIVTTAGVQVVEFTGLTQVELVAKANEFLGIQQRMGQPEEGFLQRERDRHAFLDLLGWLWDVVAAPVLSALELEPDEVRPRIWWCLTGAFTVLPLHAAGHHPRFADDRQDLMRSVPDQIVSSLVTTLAGLSRVRDRPPETGVESLLAIGVPEVDELPELPELTAVDDELDVLAGFFPPDTGNAYVVRGQATRESVRQLLPQHPWVHFSCHGAQHPTSPSDSGFFLFDDMLTVADIAELHLPRTEFAFLSACETATGGVELLDESIHLAGSMHALGYRHVIATMWSIADASAPLVAAEVYRNLSTGSGLCADNSARALASAVRLLRELAPEQPLLWAPYVHIGS